MLLEWIYAILKMDAVYHTGKRIVKVAKLSTHLGAVIYEYGKNKVEIFYPEKNMTNPRYVEELIQLETDDRGFLKNQNNELPHQKKIEKIL